MKLIQFIVKQKILVGLIFLLIIATGLLATNQLEKKLLPTQDIDGVVVSLDAGDLNALEIEEQIVTPLEQRFQSISGYDDMISTINMGNATIRVFFKEGEGDEGFREVQSIINTLRPQLTGLHSDYAFKMSTDQPFEFYMEISNGDLDEMTNFAKNILKPRLENLSEVREVALSGIVEYEVKVVLDEDALRDHSLDPSYIFNLIQSTNAVSSLGEFSEEQNTPMLRWDTTFQKTEDIENLTILTESGNIQLSELADISVQPISSMASTWKGNDSDIILIEVGRTSNVTQIDMAESVRAEVAAIEDENFIQNFEMNEIVAQADYVDNAINGVQKNVLIGGIVALFILIFFLRNVRATAIIALAIPSSILLTFTTMWVLDYSINMVSLIALGLGIGMIVDSAIVILESIYSKKEQGYSNLDSVVKGTREVSSAVIAALLTTIVVFVPIGFIGGDIGLIVSTLAIVVAITLISSVIVSFTLIPTLSEKFLKVKATKHKKKSNKIRIFYGNIVLWIAQKVWRRIVIIVLFLVVFVGSLTLLTQIPTTVMPDVFNRYTEMSMNLETGISEEDTLEVVEEVNDRLGAITDIEAHYILKYGHTYLLLVNMTKGNEITREQKEINEDIMSTLRDMMDDYPIERIDGLSSAGGYPVQVNVKGEDFSELDSIADELIAEINTVDGIVGTVSSNQNQKESLRVVLDHDTLKDDGLSAMQIKQIIEQFSIEMPIGEMIVNGDYVPIKMAMTEKLTTNNELLDYEIQTINGFKALSNYISLEPIASPNEIFHQDAERYIIVKADIEDRDLGSINRDVQDVINQYDVPTNYNVTIAGDLEEQQKAMQELMLVLVTAIFLVYLVMAVQFNNLAHPLVVMSVIPMTLVGAVLGLFVTGQELNMISGIGIIMLIGIILNNAILLLDRTKQLRRDGLEIGESIVNAGKDRIRPIFMTTLTTAGGMLPLALASGAAGNFQSPLAIVIISGLLFGTLITLVLVPSVYLLFNDIGRGLRKLFTRKKKKPVKHSKAG
ncbi:efflux RND transporter permease subunit [Virgibacillus sp. C22-A2]|uniref:Efflux RND transporter permease subunit n=1 Tax=Virgibacillus tibetensis TaxID=3042313 RepID=A0ABU6KHF1_9BACI|nr:efflux RND transporter permease subunit [Virgibacillus sp. C22-A2]